MNTISTITLLPSTKAERKSWAENAKQEILSGNYDPGTIYINIKSAMDVMKQIIDDKEVKEAVMEQTMRGETSTELSGGTLSITQKAEYHFSHDPKWFELECQIVALRQKQEAHEGLMKAATQIMTLPDGTEVHPARKFPKGEVLNCKLK